MNMEQTDPLVEIHENILDAKYVSLLESDTA